MGRRRNNVYVSGRNYLGIVLLQTVERTKEGAIRPQCYAKVRNAPNGCIVTIVRKWLIHSHLRYHALCHERVSNDHKDGAAELGTHSNKSKRNVGRDLVLTDMRIAHTQRACSTLFSCQICLRRIAIQSRIRVNPRLLEATKRSDQSFMKENFG